MPYDVIVVGARCSGASLSMLLARQGRRVLVVDRAHFPSDVLSTHFLWPRGASYLNQWGLLDRLLATTPSAKRMKMVVEGIEINGEVPLPELRRRLERVHGSQADYAVQTYCSPRRRVLDSLLLEGAREAGVEIRTGFSVESLIREGDRIVGIHGTDESGQRVSERARVVVGADGRRSRVAEAVGAERYDIKRRCTFAYFSYFSGFNLGEAQMFKRGRLGMAVVPTNFGQNMVLVYGPDVWFDVFLESAESNFLRAVEYVEPRIAELLRTHGKREEKFYGTADQTAYSRRAHGPGWALVGDAVCFKDQCTASGMTHAFRDAALLGDLLGKALTPSDAPFEARVDEALDRYDWIRSEDSQGSGYLDFVGMQAEMNPARPDDLEIFVSLQDSPEQADRFFAAYGDTVPVGDFFSARNLAWIRRNGNQRWMAHPLSRNTEARWDEAFLNPFERLRSVGTADIALSRTSFDYARPSGPNLLTRTENYFRWQEARRETDVWPFSRSLQSAARSVAHIHDEAGIGQQGINFASQDYLALNEHPAILEAARAALTEFGPHSAGSPMLIGNTAHSLALEAELGDFLKMEHVMLFPTGWGAGFGAIAALVRKDDHVVMDRLSHACLQQGAHAASSNVVRHPHCHLESVRHRLRTIRARDSRAGILVVTEGLFSMDSDVPALEAMQACCREYDATLLVDVAHDLGATGPGGTGQLGVQALLGKVDLVMGSFSKTFASNGGFLATRSPAVRQYVKMFGGPHTFSNAISPVQAAVVREALRIVRSAEGDRLRERLSAAILSLREGLSSQGMEVMGLPSPIVPVHVGDEKLLRLMFRSLFEAGVHVNAVESPAVAAGEARFRLQVMASHTPEHAQEAARALVQAYAEHTKGLALHRAPRKRYAAQS